MAEAWDWAEAKKPIVLTLKPSVSGTVTLTQGALAATFTSAPSDSLEKYLLTLDGYEDMYRIAAHTAASTSASLDSQFILPSGSYNYTAYKIEYTLTDDVLVVDSSNNKIDFTEGGSTLTATLTKGAYLASALCSEIQTRMAAAGTKTYVVSFDSVTRKFRIVQSGGTTFSLLFASGPNFYVSASEMLGFECLDYKSALTYTSAYALSGILRITKPILTYREQPVYGQSAKEAGKIFYLDSNALAREFPLGRITAEVPSRFTISSQTSDGVSTIRMNSGMTNESIRAEVYFIPVTRSLQNNSASYPKLPTPYTKFLVYGASYFLLLEKSDSKAQQYFAMAQAELKAMVNDARKSSSLGGVNYGRVIPRANPGRYYGIKV